VGEDLLDDRGLVNERNDPHGASAPWAEQWFRLIDLFDEVRPALLERPRERGGRDLDD
jgi:hypothetical protein